MKHLIDRSDLFKKIELGLESHPIVALLGPRQCGKTTIAKQYSEKYSNKGIDVTHFDLEDPVDLQILKTPRLALEKLRGIVIIDEIQKMRDLFPILRVLVDSNANSQKYIILGSASSDLIKQSSETLAGRIAYIEMTPLNLIEVHDMDKHWLLGGFPKSYLANTVEHSISWRANYIRTYLEQDIPNLGFNIEANALRRFWSMIAHYHGNIFNASELSRSLSISQPTVKRYLDILVGTFMIRELKPWHENISKRQVKQSKIYVRDSGLLHSLLGIFSHHELQGNPKLGASWEGYALEEVIRHLNVDAEDCYFWATHQGGELDLLITKHGKKHGYEFKYSDAPGMTKSIHSCLESLQLNKLTIIYPGTKNYNIHDLVQVVGLQNII